MTPREVVAVVAGTAVFACGFEAGTAADQARGAATSEKRRVWLRKVCPCESCRDWRARHRVTPPSPAWTPQGFLSPRKSEGRAFGEYMIGRLFELASARTGERGPKGEPIVVLFDVGVKL